MTKLDLAGILQTYALKISKANSKNKTIEIIKRLKEELNIKRIRKEYEDD